MSFLVASRGLFEFNPISKTMTEKYAIDLPITAVGPLNQNPKPPIFGVARWGTKIVLACSTRNMDQLVILTENYAVEDVIYFDMTNVPTEGHRQLHQVRVYGDTAYVCDTGNDRLYLVDLNTKAITTHDMAEEGIPRQHINSVTKLGNVLYVVCHRMGPSVVKALDFATLEQIDQFSMGNKAHDLWSMGGKLWTCSSGDGKLISQDAEVIDIGGFPRGIFQTESVIYVGISGRYRRVEGDRVFFDHVHNAKIKYLDPITKTFIDEYELQSNVITDMA